MSPFDPRTTVQTPSGRCLLAALSAACACGACDSAAAQSGLGRGVDLQHVAIALRLDWPARQAQGTAALTLRATRDTAQVALDAGHLAIESVSLADGRALQFDYDGGDRDQGLAITLDRSYRPQEQLTLRISYRTRWVNESDPGNLWGSTGKGIRFFAPTASDPRKRRQAWSSGDPGAQRYWFPGIDDPADWHSTEFSATVAPPLVAVGPGRLVEVRTNADGTRTYHWKQDQPHSPQRTMFVVGEYADQAQPQAAVALHNQGYPDEAQAVADSVVLLPEMLRFFAGLTGAPYPYPAYTQVFVQDFPWGHAGAGMALQTENMIDDHGTHHDYLYLWDGLQAEMLAQQWFGGLLAACDWRHAWLERGFARHLATLHAEHRHGREEFLLWQLPADQGTVMADWASGIRQPLVPAGDVDLKAFAAGNTPWSRGAAVLHMLRRELGDEAWREVLRQHVRKHAGQAVCSDQFRRVVNGVAGRSMDWFFGQWLLRAEHPVFEISHRHDALKGQLELRVRQTQAGPFQGHVDIDIDGSVHRVWLQPQADNLFSWPMAQAPQLVHFDHEGAWLKEMRHAKPAAELLHQLRTTEDAVGRQWAAGELARLVQDSATPAALRQDLVAALRDLAMGPQAGQRRGRYWRVRFNALQQLRGVLTAGAPTAPVVLDEATRRMLLDVVRDEGSWLRTAALRLLGETRDAQFVPLYLQYLKDPSDRVINAAAIALGKSRSPQAFEALAALPAHPSWKNQSLISALNGLKELGDPRGAAIATRALADVHSARWTLSTPAWDYRLAAAETLVALGQGASAYPMLHAHFEQSLKEPDVNDVFSNALLLVKLGDARARQALPLLRQRFAGDAAALKAVDDLQAQLDEALKPR